MILFQTQTKIILWEITLRDEIFPIINSSGKAVVSKEECAQKIIHFSEVYFIL